MSEAQTPTEAADPKEQPVAEAAESFKVPAPSATGNSRLEILKHDLCVAGQDRYEATVDLAGAELAIRNVSNVTIATAVFEARFYDNEGKILNTVTHKELYLPPNTSRAIVISSLHHYYEVKSYDVRLLRTTTADVEKVQLRRCEKRTTETGEEELTGIVINVSEIKLDAAVFATFYDGNQEIIGTKALVLEGIEPDTVRKYDFRFKPQEGDAVVGYHIVVGEIAR